jgi:hypothetical protein
MSTQCADAAKVLGGVVSSFSADLHPTTKLPINANENVTTDVKPGDSTDSLEADIILAPRSISAHDVALTPAAARVRAGTPAVFHVAPISTALLRECVLTALASGMEVIATLRIASPVDEELSVDVKTAVLRNCVLVTVAVPFGTPDGSLVIINKVWVAGFAVLLNVQLSCVTIGFNHAPASEGAVYAAAAVGDVPGLFLAIHKGESTEQKDTVSSWGVCALHIIYVVILLHSLHCRRAVLLCRSLLRMAILMPP